MQPENKVEPKVPEQAQPAQAPTQEEQQPKSSQDWQRFKEARLQERKKAEELARIAEKRAQETEALKAALEAALNKPQYQQPQQEYDLSDDERINRKVDEILSKKEQERERKRIEQEKQELPTRLKQNFSDFEHVCTEENLDYLQYHYPEIATPFRHMPEGYDKWASIYKAVKRFVPNPAHQGDAKKAEANLKKPQSSSAATASAPAKPLTVVLDDARKAANWERMQRTLKGLE